MSQIPIILYPSKILRQKSISIKEFHTKELDILVKNMSDTLLESKGAGLAAPQIGKNIQLIAINTKEGIVTLFNPIIIKKSWKKNIDEEGCLSVPGIFGLVKRSNAIIVKAQDIDGKKTTLNANGLISRVLQHEIDHLNGILFIDRVLKITQGEENIKKFLKT